MTNLEAIAARVFKKGGVVTGFINHRAFDVTSTRARRDFRNSIHIRGARSPEGDPVFIGSMIRRFSDTEELSHIAVRGREL